MNYPRESPTNLASKGFALVSALILMPLLLIPALSLLSFISVSLRTTNASSQREISRANARMASMIALGELQRRAGDDRRITADGSFFDGAAHPNAVGVWKSWSPRLTLDPAGTAPDYTTPKTATAAGSGLADPGFLGWLVSSPTPEDLKRVDWAETGTLSDPVDLFAESSDGFRLQGSKVAIKEGNVTTGSFAWGVSQAATKAKINVAGPEDSQRIDNDDIQAQPRPTLELTESFNQPTGNWNERAAKVINMSQAELDAELWIETASIPGGADFTAQGYGLLADVVNGGLKTDLHLGFEMSDSDFAQDQWGTVKNPFHATSAPVTPPDSYAIQRPLFAPLTQSGSVTVDLDYSPASLRSEYPAAVVPTFNTLRSFYRSPYHLYISDGQTTVFERPFDHVAVAQQIEQPAGVIGPFPIPGLGPKGMRTQTSYRPVLDRAIFILSAGLVPYDATSADFRLIMTPVVTLWNPYNVALEIEGAMLYPWMDLPFTIDWEIRNPALPKRASRVNLGGAMGHQFSSINSGRTVDPYFFASISNGNQPIRFEPGEVRVFAPGSSDYIEYLPGGSVEERTIQLVPVGTISKEGGLAVPMYNTSRGQTSFDRLSEDETVLVQFRNVQTTGSSFPFFISLEDATRIENPAARGELIADVHTLDFSSTGGARTIRTPQLPYSELLIEPWVFGVLETYHRVASDAAATRVADLVYTVNPRQAYLNEYTTEGIFEAVPHYETLVREISSTNGLISTTPDGRSAFYGATNSVSSGRSHLSFFEVPQAPLLSLAGFANADLTGTAYAPSSQFANSWASAYLSRASTAKLLLIGSGGLTAQFTRQEMPVYDFSYLANEALWDSFFFSGAAPSVEPGSATGSPDVWNNTVADISRDLDTVVSQFVDDPDQYPLRNPRMKLYSGNSTKAELKTDLLKPEGCAIIAAHLLVDGAFNVNSTRVEAWEAFLAGMRGKSFQVEGGSTPSETQTGFPRFRNPVGEENDNWHGFRSLTDSQLEELAINIVDEVRLRGPFLSLAEFVNRRISDDELGLKGALQAAIDKTDINNNALYDTFSTVGYPPDGQENISPNNTGVGIPGYLTQADVLQSLAPLLTVRSDTFTIRSYGEARDTNNDITAIARCEMVVQRVPEYVDPSDPAHTPLLEAKPANQTFGRKFKIVSFRYLNDSELGL